MLRITGTKPVPKSSYCIFCGSRSGPLEHTRITQTLARELAQQGIGIVYGGTTKGLMGVLANTALDQGGFVIGVVTEWIAQHDPPHPRIQHLHTVRTMGQRKELMLELSTAAIALPGGLGTLDEIGEALTTEQIGISKTPLILLNVGGYFDPLITFLHQTIRQGYLKPEQRHLIRVAASIEQIPALIHSPSTPIAKWPTAA